MDDFLNKLLIVLITIFFSISFYGLHISGYRYSTNLVFASGRESAYLIEEDTEIINMYIPGYTDDIDASGSELKTKNISCSVQINKLLNTYPNTPLKGRGEEMVAAVSKVAGKEDCEATKWLVAIACTESSCGRNHRNYNFVGLKGYNCKKVKCDKQGFEMFESFDQAIEIIAKRLYRPYLSKKDMDAYRGKYCQSACTHWESNVINFLSRM